MVELGDDFKRDAFDWSTVPMIPLSAIDSSAGNTPESESSTSSVEFGGMRTPHFGPDFPEDQI